MCVDVHNQSERETLLSIPIAINIQLQTKAEIYASLDSYGHVLWIFFFSFFRIL